MIESPTEVDFFFGGNTVVARDARTHIRYGEPLVARLTIEETEMLVFAGWHTWEMLMVAHAIILEGMFCRKYNVVKYRPEGSKP